MVTSDIASHDDSPSAPGELELLQRFVNLHVHDAEGTHLEPPAEQIRGFLVERGLSLESDLGAAEYRERYFGDAARKMRGHEFYRVALARVGNHAV